MSDPFVGEIKMWAFPWAPKNWLLCNGIQLPLQQYAALYSLIGVAFGGDGRTYFNLPDLRGRTPLGTGASTADPSTSYVQGQTVGAEAVTLMVANIPPHTHAVSAYTANGSQPVPASNGSLAKTVPANPAVTTPFNNYLPGPQPIPNPQPLASTTVSMAGGNAAHSNMQPFTVLNFCICAAGLYPSRP